MNNSGMGFFFFLNLHVCMYMYVFHVLLKCWRVNRTFILVG